MAELSTSNRAETDGESVVVLAERIASVLGPAMRDLEGRIESASCSQAVLAGNIDRLAGGNINLTPSSGCVALVKDGNVFMLTCVNTFCWKSWTSFWRLHPRHWCYNLQAS